jgi:hypothetical protein
MVTQQIFYSEKVVMIMMILLLPMRSVNVRCVVVLCFYQLVALQLDILLDFFQKLLEMPLFLIALQHVRLLVRPLLPLLHVALL